MQKQYIHTYIFKNIYETPELLYFKCAVVSTFRCKRDIKTHTYTLKFNVFISPLPVLFF